MRPYTIQLDAFGAGKEGTKRGKQPVIVSGEEEKKKPPAKPERLSAESGQMKAQRVAATLAEGSREEA